MEDQRHLTQIMHVSTFTRWLTVGQIVIDVCMVNDQIVYVHLSPLSNCIIRAN
jgi:hypothetical protein